MNQEEKELAAAKLAQRTLKTKGCYWFDGKEPRMHFNKKSRYITTLVWEINFGEIPAGQRVRQSCFNRLCVKPEHMELYIQQYGRY